MLLLGICALYFTFYSFSQGITGLSLGMSVLLFLGIFGGAVVNLYSSKCRYEYKYKTVAVTNIAFAFLTPAISFFLILNTPLHAEARIVATVLTYLCFAVPMLFIILRRDKIIPSLDVWKYMLKTNLPLLPHYVAASLILRISEIGVGRIFGQADLGKYSISLSIGLSVTVITNGLSGAIGPWILRKLKAGKTHEVSSFITLCTSAVILICLFVLTLAPEAVAIITTADYGDSIYAIYPLCLTVIPMFLS